MDRLSVGVCGQSLHPRAQKQPHERQDAGGLPFQGAIDDSRIFENMGSTPDNCLDNKSGEEPNKKNWPPGLTRRLLFV